MFKLFEQLETDNRHVSLLVLNDEVTHKSRLITPSEVTLMLNYDYIK